MREIAPGIFHWTTFHEGIGERVSSYYLEPERTLVDPRVPAEGLAWFRDRGPPEHVVLTNRLHRRHTDQFRRAFPLDVALHEAGHRPGPAEAITIGSLCPEETAYHFPERRALALGDAVIRHDFEGALTFVPDELMGDDPEEVKRGLSQRLEELLDLSFDHLLLAHGRPFVGRGKHELARFLERGAHRRAA